MVNLSQKGQTLIEVVAALGVSLVVISAMTVAVITALSTAQFSKNQNLATQYAQQGMEIMREKSNTEFNTFTSSATYCLSKNSTTLVASGGTSCTANIDSTFVRQVTVEPGSTDCNSGGSGGTKITVTVSWTDSKCSYTPPAVPPTDTPIPTVSVPTVGPGTPTPIATDTPTPTNSPTPTPIPYSPLTYCHEIKLTSCFSSYKLVPTL